MTFNKKSRVQDIIPKRVDKEEAIRWTGEMDLDMRTFLGPCISVYQDYLPGDGLIIKFMVHDYLGNVTNTINRIFVPVGYFIIRDHLGNYLSMTEEQLNSAYTFISKMNSYRQGED